VLIVKFLLLLLVANGMPVLARKLLQDRFSRPLDGGLAFIDGQPLFGSSKTLRGVLLSVGVTPVAAAALGLPWQAGALTGVLAMAGDLFSSFIKRRLKLPPSSRATGLDQIPESLFPALACQCLLGFSVTDIVVIVVAFSIGNILFDKVGR
jgi:CDP-diglyceride synthetase